MTKASLEKRVKALERKVRSLEPPACTCSSYDRHTRTLATLRERRAKFYSGGDR